MKTNALVFSVLLVLSGCASNVTKQAAFPLMYQDDKPSILVVVPAINFSTAADAPDYLNVTVSQPLADAGYYVLPMPMTTNVFEREGVVDGEQLKTIPMQVFKANFGADAVLFITINEWDRNYYVIGGNVSVALDYDLRSTETSESLWSYKGKVVLDTSGSSSSGNPLADLIVNTISTAINTAATRYVNVASMVHAQVLTTLPAGTYHPASGADGDEQVVNPENIKSSE